MGIEHKVKIKGGGGMVVFEASSPVSETRSASYDGFNIIHLPTSLWAYRNTSGRRFTITGKLVSRNPAEAEANAAYLQTVRSWLLPSFGTTGATPPILFLTAYQHQAISDLPCVLVNYGWNFSDDVDYIFDTAEPMPIIGILTVDLEEAWSANQITNGDWRQDPRDGGEFSRVGVPNTGGSDSAPIPFASIPSQMDAGSFAGLASSPAISARGSISSAGGRLGVSAGVTASSALGSLPILGGSTPINSSQLSVSASIKSNNRFSVGVNLNTSTVVNQRSLSGVVSDAFGRISNSNF